MRSTIHMAAAFAVLAAATCPGQGGDDRDTDGFHDGLHAIAWGGTAGDGYGFDDNGGLVGIEDHGTVVEALPLASRNYTDHGLKTFGPSTLKRVPIRTGHLYN